MLVEPGDGEQLWDVELLELLLFSEDALANKVPNQSEELVRGSRATAAARQVV